MFLVPVDNIGHFGTYEGLSQDALNADNSVKKPWISVWNSTKCCKLNSLKRHTTLNETIPGLDRNYPKTQACKNFCWVYFMHVICQCQIIKVKAKCIQMKDLT